MKNFLFITVFFFSLPFTAFGADAPYSQPYTVGECVLAPWGEYYTIASIGAPFTSQVCGYPVSGDFWYNDQSYWYTARNPGDEVVCPGYYATYIGFNSPCTAPPPCEDEEKFCQTVVVKDAAGNVVAADYKTWETRNDSSSPYLWWVSDSWDDSQESTYTTELLIGTPNCACPGDLPTDLNDNSSVIDPSTLPDQSQYPPADDALECKIKCSPDGYFYSTDGTCICVPYDPDLPPPSDAPPPDQTIPTPDNPDPTIDVGDTDPEITNKWLKAIKDGVDNSNSEINNTNQSIKDGNAILGNIDGNIKSLVDGMGQDSAALDTIKKNTAKTNNKLDEIDSTLEGMAYDGPQPTEVIFDEGVPGADVNDYTEFDDYATRATDTANQTYTDLTALELDASAPIGTLTVSGVDPCLNGNITVGGNPIPVSICFNKPWMLQGFAIMKAIMIALGYLQTAMLLNRGIAA